MKVVLDTSAIIYLNDFRHFEEIFTVNEVINEVKDQITRMKLYGIKLKIVEPRKDSLENIKRIAEKTGDLEKLSETDVKVLALAKELNCKIISDDRNIQNVAEKIGLEYISLFSEKISKFIIWKKYCRSCKKYFDGGEVCKICGGKLSRVMEKSTKIVS